MLAFAEANMNNAMENAAFGEEETLARRLEKDLTAVKKDIAHLSEQVVDAVNALASAAQDQGRRGLRQARANVDGAVSGASDRAGALAGRAQDAAASLADGVTGAIQERPVTAVALAAGIGLILGVAWRR
jgi:ElaB/YqjD/DUF883 family membrane-anchored ribosome-binding protein